MKKFLLGLSLLLSANLCLAQATGHKATITWNAPPDADATTSYGVYRTPNTCPLTGIGSLTWTKIANNLSATSYTDNSIGIGNWCYYITQTTQGQESNPSNTSGGQAKPGTLTLNIVVIN